MQDEAIVIAFVLAFWPVVLVLAFIISMVVKLIADEMEYKAFRKKLEEEERRSRMGSGSR